MRIGILGSGTAGFVTALILKNTYPNYTIDIISSSDIGIIGVGEGSTEHWAKFIDYCGIHPHEIVKHCGSTFKSGIMFKGWGSKDYLQGVEGSILGAHNETPMMYAKLIGEDCDPIDLVSHTTWHSQVPFNKFIDISPDEMPVTQYHFNTRELNLFLSYKCAEAGIAQYDDKITNIHQNEDGITKLVGENAEYKYDFYVDCSGFARLLIGKLGAEWQSYSKYLKMKRAIVFPTGDEEEYPYWTLAQAMNYGWMFRIPVWGRKGNGYIFDSDYITDEQAKAEVEEYLGHEIEIAKTISFDPGALDNTWIKNVCAIGLSASFVEPLEASSIGTSIQQAFLLASRLHGYNQASIEKYNQEVNAILDNIRDFVLLHYLTDRDDTDFWRDARNVELPKSLEHNLKIWKNKLPIAGDLNTGSKNVLFNEYNHAIVLHGLGLFDTESIKQQFESFPQAVQDYAHQSVDALRHTETSIKTIPHKMMIDLIRRLC